jgi:hypothetical protein
MDKDFSLLFSSKLSSRSFLVCHEVLPCIFCTKYLNHHERCWVSHWSGETLTFAEMVGLTVRDTSGKPPLSSRFVWAIGPDSQTETNYSIPMPVPVLAQTGTDGSPHGHVRSEGGWIIGPGSWHEPGSLVSAAAAFRAIFVPRQDFVFFSIYLFCVLYSI